MNAVPPDVRAEWEAAARCFEAVVCEYSKPALGLVNIARLDPHFGAGGLARWPDGSPYEMHPLRMALAPCGVEAVFGDGTVDVASPEALTLARAWYPFGTVDYLLDERDGYTRVVLPPELAIFTVAFDLVVMLRRALARTAQEGAA